MCLFRAMFVSTATLLLMAASEVAGLGAYAQFCDDINCTVNCGTSVSVNNPGCLNESGRLGVKFHDQNVQEVALVVSPGPDCPCQSDCFDGILNGGGAIWDQPACIDLTRYSYAQSYRFIGSAEKNTISGYGICDPNNCAAPDPTPPDGTTVGDQPDAPGGYGNYGAPAPGGSTTGDQPDYSGGYGKYGAPAPSPDSPGTYDTPTNQYNDVGGGTTYGTDTSGQTGSGYGNYASGGY